jgi:GAF domain-containing protein
MWIIESRYGTSDFYPTLEKEILSLIEGEKNIIANLANISSWFFHAIPDLNWCGFYLWNNQDQELILGPFQGLPACLRIPPSRGVCGESFSSGKTLRVNDVENFPGHIACDSASRSELVIPLIKNGIKWGVLDLDSPKISRFSDEDSMKLEKIVNLFSEKIF